MKVAFDHSQPVANNIVSFYFKPERTVRYTAGQFVELTLRHDDADERGQKHWFTLSSSPSEELLAITTKFPTERTSTFKKALQKLQNGDEVLMSDPMGDFVLPKNKSIPLVFVAGGIGITPMRSMIKWLYDNHEERNIHLLYSASTEDDVAFSELLENTPTTLVLSSPSNDWKGEKGRLDAARILEIAPDDGQNLYFVSGPEPMVESLVKDLEKSGIAERRLVGDYFPNYTEST